MNAIGWLPPYTNQEIAERVHLLCHILRLVMQPKHLQQSDIQKVNLNVAKLEEVTMEALNNFFGDKDNPNNSKRKPYLKEIFKIAKTEERYRNGELGALISAFCFLPRLLPWRLGLSPGHSQKKTSG
jgi:hypothetical protein